MKNHLITCQNGVINLRTGKITSKRSEDGIGSMIKNLYNPNATAPRFRQFLNEVFNDDKEIVEFIQKLFGYGLTGETSEQIFPVFYGPTGRNGKDSFLNAIHATVGNLCSVFENDYFESDSLNKAAGFSELRYAWIDYNGKDIFQSETLKNLIMGNTITAKRLYQNPFKYNSSCLLVLNTNQKLNLLPENSKLFDYIVLINFTQRFVHNPRFENECKADKNLYKKLKKERQGILNWLVQGAVKYYKDGLNIPDDKVKIS